MIADTMIYKDNNLKKKNLLSLDFLVVPEITESEVKIFEPEVKISEPI